MRKVIETLPHPLAYMIDYCDRMGFDVIPVRETTTFRFLISKHGDIVKIGSKRFPDWKEGQREVYTKLFNALSNEK
jgi:aldehyde:ferredoxin oxidoreductase